MSAVWLMLTLLSTPSAHAGEFFVWSFTSFGDGGGPLAGTNGWENGYPGDEWWQDFGLAFSASDDGIYYGGGNYGTGTAADNWIVRGADVQQGIAVSTFVNEDDDTIGPARSGA